MLGTVSWRRGNYDKALEYYSLALVEHELHGNKSGVALVTGNIGLVYNNLGSYDKALEYHGKALAEHELLGEKSSVALVTGNIGLVYNNLGSYDKSLEFFEKALAEHELLGEKSLVARVTGNIGLVYSNLGEYDKALEYFGKALAEHELLGNKSGVAGTTSNIGLVYSNLGAYDKALEYYQKALPLAEEAGSKQFAATITGNIGTAYAYIGYSDMALEYHGKALSKHELLGNKSGVALVSGNIGARYVALGSYDKALEYLGKALALHQELGEQLGLAVVSGFIGELYATNEFEGCDLDKAETFLLKAIALSEDIGAKKILYENLKVLADLYKKQERWKEFALHFEKYHELYLEVQSEEATKKAALMEQQKQIAEREKEIAIAHAAANAKHEATEQLLHNVLPPSIANRMIAGESLIAEKLENVSVLFADIVNFTTLSQRITAEELVAGLDRIFTSFDALAEKYGLEKIKTIGDAYMVVSGAPEPRADYAQAMAEMALEMLEAMKEFTSISTGEEIHIRIGIHSGEVVAGVIGKKKFAYDLWGDAVNTASRMESHGEAGKIHVSSDFVRELLMVNGELLVEATAISTSFTINNLPLTIIPRGEMEIKGKGMMKTYFLERTDM